MNSIARSPFIGQGLFYAYRHGRHGRIREGAVYAAASGRHRRSVAWLGRLGRSRLRTAGLLAALLAGAPRADAACAPAGDHLSGWWPADKHIFNVVNQKAALVQGAVTYVPGVAGDAFRFDGAGKVRITEATALDLSRTNRWTLTAWVRLPTSGTTASPTIYSEGNRVVALTHQPGTDKVVSWINGANPLESTVSLVSGTWCHVALVLDRTTRTLYVNGTPVGTATGTPATIPDSAGSAIGGVTTDETAAAFVGDIDELTLHRRVLSEQEIAALFWAASDGLCFGDGALAWVIEPEPGLRVPIFGDVTLTGLAMGSPRPTYQWYFNDAPLAGQTGHTLELPNVTSDQAGKYRLVAAGGDRSLAAEVTLEVEHCVDRPPGLVAWWPGDGNALEVTGHHPGKIWNGVRFGPGIAGQAFLFDGANAHVAVAGSPALSPHAGAAGEMSVEAWVKLLTSPGTVPGLTRWSVLTKGEPGHWEYTLSITNTGVPEFIVTSPAGQWYGSVIAGKLIPGTWHHLVGVLKKGAYMRLYQDGELQGESVAFTGGTEATGSPLHLGRTAGSVFALNGLVDEPAIYDRALTGEEVKALYDGGSVGKCYGGGPAPMFVQEPRDKEGYLLNSVTLEGLALGTPRPTYQWYHMGNLIAGATNAALTLLNLSLADFGPYVLVASNQFGVAQSRAMTLTPIDWAPVPHDFEKGWDGWSTDDYSIWQVGRPTSGPGSAHSGTSCAATVLGGGLPGRPDGTARESGLHGASGPEEAPAAVLALVELQQGRFWTSASHHQQRGELAATFAHLWSRQ